MPQPSVVIAGAGLGGLSTAVFLGLHGVDTLVAERHPGLSTQPKARGQMPATMEALAAAGLAAQFAAAAPPGRPATGCWTATTPSGAPTPTSSTPTTCSGSTPAWPTTPSRRPTARPGARAPHVTLPDGGSTRDLAGRGFVLLTAGRERDWGQAADGLHPRVRAYRLDDAGRELYRLPAGGAALVRPDGVVAWRSAEPAALAGALHDVLH